MANFVITYDLNGPFPSHKQMDDHLKKSANYYGRILETVWWVDFSGTAEQLRLFVATILGPEDLLLVVEVASASWTKLLIPTQPLEKAMQAAA